MVMRLPGSVNAALTADSETPLPDDYVAFWEPVNITGSTLPDATGNHDATLFGGAKKSGDYLLLDGVGDFAAASNSLAWDVSVATWYFEVIFSTQSTDSAIMSRDNTASGASHRQFWIGPLTTGEIRIIIWNASATSQIVVTSSAYDDGALHKVAITVDGSNVRIIVDGETVSSEAQTVSMSTSENIRFAIGRRNLGSDAERYFDGQLGRMGFWDYAINESILKGATK